jgi:PadR family transcriptional regulator, regulatory protein PadR
MGETSMSLMQGTVDLLILRALQADSPAHGYTVSRFVHSRTDGVLALEDAALYQALHRLEARGLIEAEWGLSENSRRAKFYRLTAAGRKQLRAATSAWRAYAAAIFNVLDGSEGSR